MATERVIPLYGSEEEKKRTEELNKCLKLELAVLQGKIDNLIEKQAQQSADERSNTDSEIFKIKLQIHNTKMNYCRALSLIRQDYDMWAKYRLPY